MVYTINFLSVLQGQRYIWSKHHTLDQFFYKNYVKHIASLSVQVQTGYSVPGSSLLLVCKFWFCAIANLIVITPNEQTGAENIVYLAGTVIRSSSFTKPGFKNHSAQEMAITRLDTSLDVIIKVPLNVYIQMSPPILSIFLDQTRNIYP